MSESSTEQPKLATLALAAAYAAANSTEPEPASSSDSQPLGSDSTTHKIASNSSLSKPKIKSKVAPTSKDRTRDQPKNASKVKAKVNAKAKSKVKAAHQRCQDQASTEAAKSMVPTSTTPAVISHRVKEQAKSRSRDKASASEKPEVARECKAVPTATQETLVADPGKSGSGLPGKTTKASSSTAKRAASAMPHIDSATCSKSTAPTTGLPSKQPKRAAPQTNSLPSTGDKYKRDFKASQAQSPNGSDSDDQGGAEDGGDDFQDDDDLPLTDLEETNFELVCPLASCGRAFERLDHLKHHLLAHSNCRPYECQRCNRKYRQASGPGPVVQVHHLHLLSRVYSLRRHQRHAGHRGVQVHRKGIATALEPLAPQLEASYASRFSASDSKQRAERTIALLVAKEAMRENEDPIRHVTKRTHTQNSAVRRASPSLTPQAHAHSASHSHFGLGGSAAAAVEANANKATGLQQAMLGLTSVLPGMPIVAGAPLGPMYTPQALWLHQQMWLSLQHNALAMHRLNGGASSMAQGAAPAGMGWPMFSTSTALAAAAAASTASHEQPGPAAPNDAAVDTVPASVSGIQGHAESEPPKRPSDALAAAEHAIDAQPVQRVQARQVPTSQQSQAQQHRPSSHSLPVTSLPGSLPDNVAWMNLGGGSTPAIVPSASMGNSGVLDVHNLSSMANMSLWSLMAQSMLPTMSGGQHFPVTTGSVTS
ncbi:uncharacterized protein MONBRDRAFT_37465 [Monosiga brevicollis MX1]|uniref:C2H2-type domain-containing protein n=1 Tax=Monosiga brevicollis TaxID=81824 RepID=A9V1X5_MONBE|nr:uncharacterized protein MONBRDRAFT_37465 [Monosiga brevicollis MX1]EDQ88640.1 predicted protein [Monosiga brevicollis MX1]|eukprot:XP_001746744.1 hypothetical protein [Monosiga brevicollis MX1]